MLTQASKQANSRGMPNMGAGQWVFVPAGATFQTPFQKTTLGRGPGRASTPQFMQNLKMKALQMTGKAASSSAVINVRGFDFGTTEEAVRKHCSKYGKVIKVELKGEKGGNAIVTYAKPKSAEVAVEKLQDTIIEGNERFIRVKLQGKGSSGGEKQVAAAKPGARKRKGVGAGFGKPDGKTVRVRGFDKGTELDAVVDHCTSAGTIVESKMDKKRQMAFLTFSSKEEATAAVDTLDNTTIPGNDRYIVLKIHEPDEAPSGKKAGNQKKKKEGPTGPDLPREAVNGGATMTGKVLRIKGKFGFIKANDAIDHPDAAKHKGDIYFSMKDVEEGVKLERDNEVEFTLYSDADGLGAQDIKKL